MTNVQLYLAMFVPSVMVLIGILINRSDNQTTRAEVHALRADTRADFQTMRSELRAESQALRAEMVMLRTQIHADMVALHEHVAVVEAKQG